MQQPRTHHWTYEDYLALPDDGTRCEIIEGERLMTPAPFTRHQIVSQSLNLLLLNFVESHGLGEVLCAPCDVILSDDTVVQPDLLFISIARKAIIKERGIFGAPDLVVEILSPSSEERDTVHKLRLYGRHGVREYWIVDPDADRTDVFLLEGRRLVKTAEHSAGDVRSLAALAGFSAPLTKIFQRR